MKLYGEAGQHIEWEQSLMNGGCLLWGVGMTVLAG